MLFCSHDVHSDPLITCTVTFSRILSTLLCQHGLQTPWTFLLQIRCCCQWPNSHLQPQYRPRALSMDISPRFNAVAIDTIVTVFLIPLSCTSPNILSLNLPHHYPHVLDLSPQDLLPLYRKEICLIECLHLLQSKLHVSLMVAQSTRRENMLKQIPKAQAGCLSRWFTLLSHTLNAVLLPGLS